MRYNKYGAKKITIDGIRFDSLKEGRRYSELKSLENAGEIYALAIHPVYPIVINDHKICKYIGDFEYCKKDSNTLIVEDVKGGKATLTPASRLKHKLVLALYGIEVRIV